MPRSPDTSPSAIAATTVVTPHGQVGPAEIRLRDGRITEVVAVERAPRRIVAPGFVDLQVNGHDDVDVGHATGTDWGRLDQHLLRQGVTTWCPTLTTRPLDAYAERLQEIARAAKRVEVAPRIAGVHLEGPFIAPDYARAHPREFVRQVDLDWLGALPPIVRVVTLAPELPHAEVAVALLADRGILVALGHSGADSTTVRSAIDAGARLATHIFNAMAPLDHRRPGLVGAALGDRRLAVSVIADGIHVDEDALALVLAATGPTRTVLVTDATATGDERTERAVTLVDGAPRLGDGTLAGSALTMNAAVARCVAVGASLDHAIAAASTVPAKLLGLSDLGRIEPGARADLVALRDDYSVSEVWIDGRVAALS